MDPIVEKIGLFNQSIPAVISGPDCTDPQICKGNCCFIKIDVARSLAEWLISNHWADFDDFNRGAMFAFQIKVNLDACKCVFFDSQINGCSLHKCGYKPPQCWVYPTGLDPDDCESRCKQTGGWEIKKPQTAIKLNNLLTEIVQLSKEEALAENSPEKIKKRLDNLEILDFGNKNPKNFAGLEDSWDNFILWFDSSLNLSLKPFCKQLGCKQDFFNCSQICHEVLELVHQYYLQFLPEYIQKEGFRARYSLLEVLRWQRKR